MTTQTTVNQTVRTIKINNFSDNYAKLDARIRKNNKIYSSNHSYNNTILITKFKKYDINLKDETISISHFDYFN